MDDLLSEFLTETTESLDSLDNDLIKLEENPNDPDLLSNIFRLVHTIKGTCGFLGLPRLEAVAHSGENVLGKIRDGELEVSEQAISIVLEALDQIKEILGILEATESEPEGDDTDLITRLNAMASGEAAPPPAEAPLAESTEPPAEEPAAEEAPAEEAAAEEAPAEGDIHKDAGAAAAEAIAHQLVGTDTFKCGDVLDPRGGFGGAGKKNNCRHGDGDERTVAAGFQNIPEDALRHDTISVRSEFTKTFGLQWVSESRANHHIHGKALKINKILHE